MQLEKLTQAHRQTTAKVAATLAVEMCVGETTYLDDKAIKLKRQGYGRNGNGGNGLILHTGVGVEPESGQPLGLLWQKLWHRPLKAKAPANETSEQKRQRQTAQRQAQREKLFEEKESYRYR